MAHTCVRELVMAQDIGMTCGHSCRNAYVVSQCVCNDGIMALHVHLDEE